MLLELGSNLDRSACLPDKREQGAAKDPVKGKPPVQRHHCGLLQRGDCPHWSFMAAILWWILS